MFLARSKRHQFLQIYGLIILCGILAISGASLLLSVPFTQVTSKVIKNRTLDSLQASSNMFSHINLQNMSALIDLPDNPKFLDYFFMETPQSMKALKALEEIDSIVMKNSFIHSIYIYSSKYGSISNLKGWEKENKEIEQFLDSTRDTPPKVFVPRKAVIDDKRINFYTMILGRRVRNNNIEAAIVVNLSVDQIAELLRLDTRVASTGFAIIGMNNTVLLHPDPDRFGTTLEQESFLSPIANNSGKEGTIDIDVNGDKYIAWWIDHRELPWRFILFSPKKIIFSQIIFIKKVIAVVIVFWILFYISTVFILYKGKEHKDQLKKAFKNIFKSYPDHNTEDEHIVESFFKKKGGFTSLAIISLDNTKKMGAQELSAISNELEHRLQKISKQTGARQDLLIGFNSIRFCYISKLSLDLLHSHIDDIEEISFSYNSTQIDSSISVIAHAFLTLQDALRYTYRYPSNTRLPSKIEASAQPFDVNEADIDRFTRALRLENSEEVWTIVKQLLEACASNGTNESFSYLLHILFYRIDQMDIYRELYNETNILSIDSIPEAYRVFESFCKTIESNRLNKSEKKKRELYGKAKSFIELHICDPNLCPELVAEEMGKSLGYIRKLFRNLEGSSMSQYIGSMRVEKAKQLLKETSFSIREISEMTGFLNYSYFFTYFKKTQGKTPGEYRNELRQKG